MSGTVAVCHFCFSGVKWALLPTSQETGSDQDFDLLTGCSIEEQDAFIINILIHLSCSNLLHKPRIILQRNVEDKSSQVILWATESMNAEFLQIWVLCLLNSASHPIIVALLHVPLKCPLGIDSTRCSCCAAIHRLASWPGYIKCLYSASFFLMGVIKLGSLPSM